MKKGVKLSYIISIHILLVLLIYHSISPSYKLKIFFNLFKAPEPSETYISNNHFYRTQSTQDMSSTSMFIGDSHIQGLNTSLASKYSVNYGIGGDDISGVINRLVLYTSNTTPKNIILMIGINDILHNIPFSKIHNNIKQLSNTLPSKSNIFWMEIMPINTPRDTEYYNPLIKKINNLIKTYCNEMENCNYVKTPKILIKDLNLNKIYNTGDGVHLNKDGYKHLINHLKNKVSDTL